MKKYTIIILLLFIVLFGIFLRFDRLGERSFWYDEIQDICNKEEVVKNYRFHFPKLYLNFFNIVTDLAGYDEFFCRLPSAIFGVLTIFVVYKLTVLLFGSSAGLLSALLIAVSTFHISYSQLARFYSLHVLLSTCSIYFLYKGFLGRKSGGFYIIIYFIITILNLGIHFVGIYVFASQIIFLIGYGSYCLIIRKKMEMRVFVALLLIISGSIFVYIFLPKLAGDRLKYIILDMDTLLFKLKDIGEPLKRTWAAFTPLASIARYGRFVSNIYLFGFIVGIFVCWRKYKREFFSMMIFVFVPIFFDAILNVNLFQQRHVLSVLPVFLICVALGFSWTLSKVKPKALIYILLILLVGMHVRPLIWHHISETDDWRAMGNYLNRSINKGDGVMFSSHGEIVISAFMKICPYFHFDKDIPVYDGYPLEKEYNNLNNLWYILHVKDWFEGDPRYLEFKKKWFVFQEIKFNGYISLLQLKNIDNFKIESFNTEIFEAEFFPGQVGKTVKDRNAYCRLARQSSDRGMMLFGPYKKFPKGNYIVRFRLKVNNNTLNEEIAVLDVNDFERNKQLNILSLKAIDFSKPYIYQDFEMCLNLEYEDNLEFRVFSCGNVILWVDNVVIIPVLREEAMEI